MKNAFTLLFFLISFTAFSQKKLVATYSERLNNGNYVPYDSVYYHFNADGLLSKENSKYLDPVTGSWKNLLSYEYSYNANGDITSKATALWLQNQWTNNNFATYFYQSDKLESIIETRWYNGKWNNNTKEDYFYSTFDEADSIIKYNYDTTNNLEPFTKKVYTYNSNGDVTEEILHYWSNFSQSWFPSLRTRYVYDANGLNTKYYVDTRNQLGWTVDYSIEIEYDSEGDVTTWARKNGSGTATIKGFYFYDRAVAITQPLQQNTVTVYPNPASDEVFFSFEGNDELLLTISNIEGKSITQQRVVSGYSENVTTYPKGVYFYSLKNKENKVVRGKFSIR